MAKQKQFLCPICDGTGRIEDPHKMSIDVTELKREMAIRLRSKGFSFRQIQRALDYKSVRSVQHLLK